MEHSERRRGERITVSLEAKLNIIIPENTFQPIEVSALVVDLSERGALLVVRLDPETYSALLQKTRYCRISLLEPNDELPEKITGRAVWIQPQGSIELRNYRLGLFFEDCPETVSEKLKAYIDKRKRTFV